MGRASGYESGMKVSFGRGWVPKISAALTWLNTCLRALDTKLRLLAVNTDRPMT